MEASKIDIAEQIAASRKLQKGDAQGLLRQASKLIVAKGKKLSDWDVSKTIPADALSAMLGPTGNLRAPTLRVGKTLMVGFNEGAYQELFD